MATYIITLSHKDKREWVKVNTLNDANAEDAVIIASSLKAAVSDKIKDVSITIVPHPIGDVILDPNEANVLLQQWLQKLIIYSFESACHLWNYSYKGPKTPIILILGKIFTVRKFTMFFVSYNSSNFDDLPKKCVQLTCNNHRCCNPGHMRLAAHPRQKLLDPELIIEYATNNPDLSQAALARIFGCSESAMSRLLNKKSFASYGLE